MIDRKPIISSQDYDDTYYSKSVPQQDPEFLREPRQRANTLCEGNKNEILEPEKVALPTVFKWDGGGKAVFI